MQEHKLSRRIFLKSSTGAAAAVGVAGAALVPGAAQAAAPAGSTATNLNYPKRPVGKAGGMPVNQAVSFSYPDASSPCVALRMGSAVPGGVGPSQDIVAFSSLCTHMGCPVAYDGGTKTFKCNCHFSTLRPGERRPDGVWAGHRGSAQGDARVRREDRHRGRRRR